MALDKERQGKYDEAIAIFKSIFVRDINGTTGRVALIKIEECFTKAGRKDFIEFSKKELKPLLKESTESFVVLLELETHQLVKAGQYNFALANLELIKFKYTLNDHIDKNNLFRIGVFYTQYFNDKVGAKKVFDELVAKYPNDPIVEEINILMSAGNARNNYALYSVASELVTTNANKGTLELGNYPNPFNPTTTIRYSIPVETRHASSLQLIVYDILGREIATLVNEEKTPCNYAVKFNAANLTSGVYFYTLQVGSFSQTKKLVLIK